VKARHAPCWLCGQPIDYTLPAGHPQAFTVDHVQPRSQRPDLAEDPANLRAAHAKCNKARGTAAPRHGLGAQSRAW
jgi:5-methylcytosine-specific restriction endonuclease McrA